MALGQYGHLIHQNLLRCYPKDKKDGEIYYFPWPKLKKRI